MPNDTGSALHPYDLVFSPSLFEEERFPGIAEEAEARGAAARDPDAFLMLASVGALLRALMPEDAAPRDVRAEMLRVYGRLLFHAWHYWREGKRTLALEEPEARALVEGEPATEEWRFAAPGPAGYLRLPRNLFWGRVEEGATPEAVDGLFWTLAPPAEEADPGRLHLLLVLGLRPDRPGFGSIDVSGAADSRWVEADARPGGEDFANVLPGGELEGLHALTTEAEALKLACLALGELGDG